MNALDVCSKFPSEHILQPVQGLEIGSDICCNDKIVGTVVYLQSSIFRMIFMMCR